MAVKTITVTTDAYEALRALKGEKESFTDVILRITGSRSLRGFAGILSKESGDRLARAVRVAEHEDETAYQKRLKRIVRGYRHGRS
ncbi:antitoxin VapB family protein [Candidatus Woesearchaeota archaeon]|nr:antitoxin VapB family protein [Candidatus Woesearchaeota archaeon]